MADNSILTHKPVLVIACGALTREITQLKQSKRLDLEFEHVHCGYGELEMSLRDNMETTLLLRKH